MLQEISNPKQQELSRYEKLSLVLSIVMHLYFIYLCVFTGPAKRGAKNFIELLYFWSNEIQAGRFETTGKEGVLVTIIFVCSVTALISSVVLYLRKNYILTLVVVEVLLALEGSLIAVYHNYISLAVLICVACLYNMKRFIISLYYKVKR